MKRQSSFLWGPAPPMRPQNADPAGVPGPGPARRVQLRPRANAGREALPALDAYLAALPPAARAAPDP